MMMVLARKGGAFERQEPTKTLRKLGHLRVKSSGPPVRGNLDSRRSFEAVTGRTHGARMVVSGGIEHAFNSTPDGPVRWRWFADSSGF